VLALLERFDLAARELLRSLATAGIDVTPVFIEYDGELPAGALCPFVTYTGIQREGEPLFFDEVPVPPWCEIRQGRQPYAEILRDGEPIGRIHYEPNSFRQVERVDWMLPDRTLGHTDHYDRAGNRYARSYRSRGVVHQTVYRSPGAWEIEVDHIARAVTMRSPERLLTFETLTAFVSHFLDDQGLAEDRVLIDSLSTPLFVMRRRAATPNTTLFWHEPMPGGTPGNMAMELERPRALERIVVHDEALRQRLAARHPGTSVGLHYLSHLGRFAEHDRAEPRRAFTLTNTDELPALPALLEAFPDVTFSVAALTLMSERLHELGRRHPNLTLIPTISHSRIREELDRAAVYLDINGGAEVLDVVKAAYHLNLVVLALEPHAKSPDHAWTCATVEELGARLSAVVSSPRHRRRALDELHTRHGPLSTPADYRRVLGSPEEVTRAPG